MRVRHKSGSDGGALGWEDDGRSLRTQTLPRVQEITVGNCPARPGR